MPSPDYLISTSPGSARDRAYRYVREQLLLGHFAGGSFVEEEQVSSALGVSRTPVREAFHRLAAERFVDLIPRRGAQVRQIALGELFDLSEARLMIEGHAIRRICRQGISLPEATYAILDELASTPASDLLKRVEMNFRFHFALVSAVGNIVLMELYQSLAARLQIAAMAAINVNPVRFARNDDEHRSLVTILRKRDEREALAALEHHLRPISGRGRIELLAES